MVAVHLLWTGGLDHSGVADSRDFSHASSFARAGFPAGALCSGGRLVSGRQSATTCVADHFGCVHAATRGNVSTAVCDQRRFSSALAYIRRAIPKLDFRGGPCGPSPADLSFGCVRNPRLYLGLLASDTSEGPAI